MPAYQHAHSDNGNKLKSQAITKARFNLIQFSSVQFKGLYLHEGFENNVAKASSSEECLDKILCQSIRNMLTYFSE